MLIHLQGSHRSQRLSSFHKQEHPVNLQLKAYMLSLLELSCYAHTGWSQSPGGTLRNYQNERPTSLLYLQDEKKLLQAEHNSVFSDPYWESHIQALHSMASRQHLTWPTLPLFATQHSSCAWAANLRARYAKAFAYTEITVAASAARSETIRSANCCYHGLLVPLAQVLLYTRWSKCSKITSPHGSPSSNSSACKSLSY